MRHWITALALALCMALRAPGGATAPGGDGPQYTRQDSMRVAAMLRQAKGMGRATNWMVHFARQLRGTPYVAQTLEGNDRERLVVNLRQMDCTTYIENVAALSLCMKNGKASFADFCSYLRQLRYEGGKVGYATRLHYFTAWAEDNERMGFVGQEIQGPNPPFSRMQTIRIDYMSRHPERYPMLKAHPAWTKDIARMERRYNGRRFRFIPKEAIANSKLMRETIHDGDIIAILTSKSGLDTSHLGIAVWHKDGLHLLNASMVRHKVVEEPWTLRHYMSRHPSQTGIRVVRMK